MGKTKWLLAFVLFLNLFFFRASGSVSFVLLSLGFLLFQLVLFRQRETLFKMKRTVLILAAFFTTYSVLLIVRGSAFVESALRFGIIVLIMFFLCLLKDGLPFFRSLYELVVTPFNFGISYFLAGLNILDRIFSGTSDYKEKSKEKHQSSWSWIVKGLLIALPIAYFLIILLSLADPVFRSFATPVTDFVARLFSGGFFKEIVKRIIPSTLAAVAAAPFVYFYAKKKELRRPVFIGRFPGPKEMVIVMTLVTLTLLSFIVIQWPYIFVNVPFETDLSKFGVATYSEYVKRGFVEFILITLFVYGILWAGLLAVRKVGDSISCRILFTLQMLVLAEFLLILLSVFRRIYLYQLYHGLSLGRIYGGMILAYIALLAVVLLFRHFRKASLVKFEAAALGFLILILGLFNAESFIVSFHPPTVNKRIDYIYLSRLSPDGYDGWYRAYKYAENILMEKGLGERKIVGKDERREVAYAGIIIGNFTDDYDRLLFRYGSKEEIKAYLKAIFQSELVDRQGWYLNFDSKKEKDLEKTIQKYFTDKLRQLEDPDPDFSYIIRDLNTNNLDFGYMSFEYDWKTKYAFYTFYLDGSNMSNKAYAKTTFLDRIYTFNLSQKTAYERIKKDIPAESLVTLQHQFKKLFDKIALQPEGERDYDTDISLQTPFL